MFFIRKNSLPQPYLMQDLKTPIELIINELTKINVALGLAKRIRIAKLNICPSKGIYFADPQIRQRSLRGISTCAKQIDLITKKLKRNGILTIQQNC